jgi:hypothetical protein
MGGGYIAAPPCVIDECDSFGSNTIYPHGRAKFTSIFILRKHNCNLLSSGMPRQCTLNCSSKECERLRCDWSKGLFSNHLLPQAIGCEETLMLD